MAPEPVEIRARVALPADVATPRFPGSGVLCVSSSVTHTPGMTDSSTTPECVSKDIIASAMSLIGYSSEGWAYIYTLTMGNIAISAGAAWVFLPFNLGLPAASGAALLGLVLMLRLIHIQSRFKEHTLIVRNALERRLGIPEYARHRQSYVRPEAWAVCDE